MYKKMMSILASLLLMAVLGNSLRAQDDVTEFLKFGQENANQLSQLYLSPLGSALGNNLNTGWHNTGQAHKLGRFDIRFAVPVTFIGVSNQTFRFIESDFQGLSLVNPSENLSPTVFGEDKSGPWVSYEGESFQLPQGSGYQIFPLIPPVVQLTVGLVKDTELMFRFVPEIEVDKFSTQMFGIGVKHGIRQYIPGIKHLPFEISLIAAYSKFNAGYDLSYNPDNNPAVDVDLQKLDMTASAWNVNLIASKKLSVITFYGGIRYMSSDMDFSLAGNYAIKDTVINTPVSLSTQDSQVGLNGGFRLKLGFFSLFADGTLARYSSVNAGFSLGFH